MGKSLSSSKKKRSRDSSQSRLRRRSAKKISKSKRLKRRDDSGSSSSESLSSSSSEDDYRRKKSRSGTRKKAKLIKRRSRRRSSSSDSTDSSLDLKKKKKKRSKRKKSYEAKKRSRPSKKRRKYVSLSSASSESCSTSPTTDLSERKRGRYEDRDIETKELDMVTIGTKRSQERSRSCSLSVEGGEGDDYWYEEEITCANSKKRLRSVIVVANNIRDDKNKEEIVCDDDYPSSRSNDSNNDRGFKRVYEHYHVEPGENMQVEYETEVEASSARHDESEPKDVLLENSNQISVNANDLEGGDDLESILRRRALENLKRFQGPPKNSDASMNQTDRHDNEKTVVVADCESAEVKSENLTGHGLSTAEDLQVSAERKLRANAGSVTNRPKLVRTVWRRETSDYSAGTKQATGSMTGANVGTGVPETPQTLTKKIEMENSEFDGYPQDRQADDTHMDASAGSYANRPKLVRSVWRRESSNLGNRIETAGPETSQAKANQASDSKDGEPTSQDKTETRHDETKGGSQFEQKTMSVMRGGEMVQVSYKVYIPKKTPALARRVLKR